MAKSPNEEVKINGHPLNLTNLDKVYWPAEGYTKGELIEYYRSIAPILLPYLKDRPENLNRHPNGIKGESFFQKDMRDGGAEPPSWIKTIPIKSESNDKVVDYLVCNNEAALVYMTNLGCIELNPWNSRVRKLEYPDYIIMDFDPEAIGFEKVVEAAQTVHEICERAGIKNYCKTSGASGLHVCIPLGAKYTYEQARNLARVIATLAHQQLPKITSLERSPAKRQRKVYLDYLQNSFGQTLAVAYCVRPQPGVPVSTPLEWKEVRSGLEPGKFNVKTIFERIRKMGDLWKPVLGQGIDLENALKKLR